MKLEETKYLTYHYLKFKRAECTVGAIAKSLGVAPVEVNKAIAELQEERHPIADMGETCRFLVE